MSDGAEQVPLSGELLAMMRHAAALATTLREPFITVRTLLLAMLDDSQIGPALVEALPRERLESYAFAQDAVTRLTASRVPEPSMPPGERPALLRFNTLAFKLPDGSRSIWLSREAQSAWIEGAKRVEDGGAFLPIHLAFGIAADALRSPGILAAMHISPGTFNEAVMALEQPNLP